MVLKVTEEQLLDLTSSSLDSKRYFGHNEIDARRMSPMTLAMIYKDVMRETDTIQIIKEE